MASALGIDMGNVYRTVEAVKTSRAARGAQETAAENALATKAATQDAAANAIANPSDPAATAALAVLDPQMAATITNTFTAADERARQELERQNDVLAQTAAAILGSDDPANAYTHFMSQLPPEVQQTMPDQFDPNWVKLQLARATEVDKLYETLAAQNKAETDRANELADDDRDQQQAIELEGVKRDNEIAAAVAKAETESGASASIESADMNAISRAAADLFGGVFDAEGKLQNLDPSLRARVLDVASRASRLFAGGGLTHAEAVKKAAEESGGAPGGPALAIPAPQNGAYAPGDDPAGIL